MRIEIVALMLFAVSAAHAETIYKCSDANGVTEYTQSPCARGSIKVLNTDGGPSEADSRKAQARLAAEIERNRAQEEQQARLRAAYRAANMQLFSPAPAKQQVDPYFTEKRLVGTKEGWDRKTQAQIDLELKLQVERAKAAQVEQARTAQTGPSLIANCDPGGCNGTDGTRYNRGAGNTLFGSNGKTCQFVAPGAPLNCN